MDLSNFIDILNRDISITKLHAYGFQRDTLELLYSYLTKR